MGSGPVVESKAVEGEAGGVDELGAFDHELREKVGEMPAGSGREALVAVEGIERHGNGALCKPKREFGVLLREEGVVVAEGAGRENGRVLLLWRVGKASVRMVQFGDDNAVAGGGSQGLCRRADGEHVCWVFNVLRVADYALWRVKVFAVLSVLGVRLLFGEQNLVCVG